MYSIIFLTSRLFHVDVAFYDYQSYINIYIYSKKDTDSQCMYMSFEDEKKNPTIYSECCFNSKDNNSVYLISILITISIFQ